jgi:hypothetical protein
MARRDANRLLARKRTIIRKAQRARKRALRRGLNLKGSHDAKLHVLPAHA